MIYAAVLVHSTFDIFIETYFGNEIELSSSRLSYALFESDWMDQSNVCKRSMIILMEPLKRPQKLIVAKIYPLDLEIFTNVRHILWMNSCMLITLILLQILNAAYSMFNILKNLE